MITFDVNFLVIADLVPSSLCVCVCAGAGSTPLHYAACGGNLKCCQARLKQCFSDPFLISLELDIILFFYLQILLARGASRLALNCNG